MGCLGALFIATSIPLLWPASLGVIGSFTGPLLYASVFSFALMVCIAMTKTKGAWVWAWTPVGVPFVVFRVYHNIHPEWLTGLLRSDPAVSVLALWLAMAAAFLSISVLLFILGRTADLVSHLTGKRMKR